jgi:threonine dehydrogenase-like Zn-dependent dehydrogenase
MKAVVYGGPREIEVKDMPDARIERATDVLVEITTTNICGSDLHMYEGRTAMEPGRILGHENLGLVVEVGPAVDRIKVGDRVCLPFNIGCGFCENCERGLSGFCVTTNPGMAGAAYGFAGMDPTAAVKPNCCGSPTEISIACCSRGMRKKRRMTT